MSTLSASIEWLKRPVALIRVHAEGDSYGAPYTFGCVIQDCGDGVAYVSLANGPYTPEERRAVCAALQEAGFTSAKWERRNGKAPREISIEIGESTWISQ